MPGIDEMKYGYNEKQVSDFLETTIKRDALVAAQEAVADTSKIETACTNNWEGQARVNFLENLAKDKQHVSDQFDNLYAALADEVYQVINSMKEKDNNMINNQ